MNAAEFVPHAGAVRYQDPETGEWRCANPRDLMFSTVTMMATEFWAEDRGWVKIFEEDEGAAC